MIDDSIFERAIILHAQFTFCTLKGIVDFFYVLERIVAILGAYRTCLGRAETSVIVLNTECMQQTMCVPSLRRFLSCSPPGYFCQRRALSSAVSVVLALRSRSLLSSSSQSFFLAVAFDLKIRDPAYLKWSTREPSMHRNDVPYHSCRTIHDTWQTPSILEPQHRGSLPLAPNNELYCAHSSAIIWSILVPRCKLHCNHASVTATPCAMYGVCTRHKFLLVDIFVAAGRPRKARKLATDDNYPLYGIRRY